jgi:hypothetical protein
MLRKFFDIKWGGPMSSTTTIIPEASRYGLQGNEKDELNVSVFFKPQNVGGMIRSIIYAIISNQGRDLSYLLDEFPVLIEKLESQI